MIIRFFFPPLLINLWVNKKYDYKQQSTITSPTITSFLHTI